MVAVATPLLTSAEEPANDDFVRTWERPDRPVASGAAVRTWIWGPEAFTGGLMESYAEGQNGQRLVQYFDKSRMEISVEDGISPESPWYVVNGLLATELITGRLQTGDNTFEDHEPAAINVAGDMTDPTGPTYATFFQLLGADAYETGSTITATVNRDAVVGDNPDLAAYGVTAEAPVAETGHAVASVFWQFMIAEGTIYENDAMGWGPLFVHPFFATGLPITEAYWTSVQVDGEPRDVLVQAFERRVLTYTPGNPAGWEVEAGNVGRHYYEWRYMHLENPEPEPTPTEEPTNPEPEEPTPTETPDIDAEMPPFGRGQIGTRQTEPLGRDAVSPLSEPYLAIPSVEKEEFGFTVLSFPTSKGMRPKVNQQTTVSLVNNSPSPSGEIVYVVDFNDGSVYVGGVIKNNYGIFVPHTFRGEGTYTIRAWTIDPHTGIRTLVTVKDMVVEKP
jgi:hypothetical protein